MKSAMNCPCPGFVTSRLGQRARREVDRQTIRYPGTAGMCVRSSGVRQHFKNTYLAPDMILRMRPAKTKQEPSETLRCLRSLRIFPKIPEILLNSVHLIRRQLPAPGRLYCLCPVSFGIGLEFPAHLVRHLA